MTPEQEQELFKFMGSVTSSLENIKEDINSLGHVREDVQNLKTDFSNLKGKLAVVAGIVTFVINCIWQAVKGVF